jgi:hypothetical protein
MGIKVEVTGFSTREQAEKFITWYSKSGEQDFEYWTEEDFPDFSPYTNLGETFPISWNDDTVKLVLKGDIG